MASESSLFLAIAEERESTTVLPPGVGARVDEYGSLIVEVVP